MPLECNESMSAEMREQNQEQGGGVSSTNTASLTTAGEFIWRHIGPQPDEISQMLAELKLKSLEQLVERTVPQSIRSSRPLRIPTGLGEAELLALLKGMVGKNEVFRSFIGAGYANALTPAVIQRNILENPGWYTQYTPYQAEISQGRLEALVNFQTMIADLTGMELANASLLDEGTAAAEAVSFSLRLKGEAAGRRFFVASDVHPQTRAVVETRCEPLGIQVISGKWEELNLSSDYLGVLIQYPTTDGKVCDYRAFAKRVRESGAFVVVAADLLSLLLLTPPGEWGADVVVGNSQRFGVPLGFGGPHAAFFATKDEYKRQLPGRLVGVSKDASGKPAYRLALQTREQHIKRDRATSNICTAQVLLAVIASMYAVYHGPRGLRRIALRVNRYTAALRDALVAHGYKLRSDFFFDTLRVETKGQKSDILQRALAKRINFRIYEDESVGITLDETVTEETLGEILDCFPSSTSSGRSIGEFIERAGTTFPDALARRSSYLTHPVFNRYHSETELLRYMRRLESRDLSLTASMIPLGSCTMKLNATTEMYPVTWPEFGALHPFAPEEQAEGYLALIRELESFLGEITGFAGISLQPNAGSQGEYAGLLVIRAYHRARGENHRDICLIPSSAHGTNPATASMVGWEVVVVDCDSSGNVDLADLRKKAEAHSDRLAALMITYPSTHGVFEERIREVTEIVHHYDGQVYMDGANLNAQVGLCRPADFGADVCHLNLHKTFCIPHGGGGPGVGPIGVREHLVQFLPGHAHGKIGGNRAIGPVSSAPWGSAGILCIPWVYIKLMGGEGLTRATQVAILNANYIAARLDRYFPVLYRGEKGFVAHECILDLREIKKRTGVDEIDIAKRLMDYGFHAPTVSFPVVGTLMVEPTESESKAELDRFCEAMVSIYGEIEEIGRPGANRENNVLKNAPHTGEMVCADEWSYPYSREKAAFPVPGLRSFKFWPSVRRIDNAYGDRNLFCACVPADGLSLD